MKKIIIALGFLFILFMTSCNLVINTEGSHTITYIVNETTYQKISYSDTIDKFPSNPDKIGYDFLGWYYDENGEEIVSKGDIIEGNLKVYGFFTPIYYDATFYGYNGKKIAIKSFTIEDKKIKDEPVFPSKKGYIEGWEYVLEGKDIDIYPRPIEYHINYELNGGTLYNCVTSYNVETESFPLQSPIREGYVFEGWYINSYFLTRIRQVNKGSTGDITVFAKWKENVVENYIEYGDFENQNVTDKTILNSDGINNILGVGRSGEYAVENGNTYVKLGMGYEGFVTNGLGNNVALKMGGLDFNTLGQGYYILTFDLGYHGGILEKTSFFRVELHEFAEDHTRAQTVYFVTSKESGRKDYLDAVSTYSVSSNGSWNSISILIEVSKELSNVNADSIWFFAAITNANANDYYMIDNVCFNKIRDINLTIDSDIAGANVTRTIKESDFSVMTLYTQNGIKGLSFKYLNALSGEYSINQTRTNAGVQNADIGLISSFNDEMYIFFGDTIITDKNGVSYINNNTYAKSTDFNYSDGIEMEYITVDGKAKAIINSTGTTINSKGKSKSEQSKIPNGAVQIGDTFYMMYMSVRQFTINGDPDAWTCNYGGMVKSKDGVNWTEVTSFKTDEESNFLQNYPVYNKEDGYVYVFGIGAGRHTRMKLMRVKAEDFEDLSKYEYLQGINKLTKKPIWGNKESDYYVVDNEVWEFSVVFNPYLGMWLITYTSYQGTYIYTSYDLCGEYDLAAIIYKPGSISAGWYCCYTSELLMKENGKKMACLMSFMSSNGNWDVCVYEMTFEK